MKKILFVTNSLSIGGISTSLKNTLKQVSSMGYTIDVFTFDNSKRINIANINYISSNWILKIMSMSSAQAKTTGFCTYIVRSILALLCKLFGANCIYGIVFKFCKDLGEYDIAISFSNNLNCNSLYFGANKFVLEKVKSTKKMTWVHVDYEKMKIDNKVSREAYKKFDKIITVSNAVKEVFLKYNNTLNDKCTVVYNCLDIEELVNLSEEEDKALNNTNSIVCVGRLDENKNQIELVKLAEDLKKHGLNFKIYLIGDGTEREKIENEIKRLNVKDNIEILGWTNNPYTYMKKAKILVSVSLTESFGLAIAEALALNTPVVTQYFPAAEEIINNGNNGIICNNYKELLEAITNLLTNETEYINLKENSKLFITTDLVRKQLIETFEE